jgi:hypothetical protein
MELDFLKQKEQPIIQPAFESHAHEAEFVQRFAVGCGRLLVLCVDDADAQGCSLTCRCMAVFSSTVEAEQVQWRRRLSDSSRKRWL